MCVCVWMCVYMHTCVVSNSIELYSVTCQADDVTCVKQCILQYCISVKVAHYNIMLVS